MANEQIIDQVIAPVTDAQVSSLTKLLVDLDVQMVTNIKTANQLNVVTGNSKSFTELSKNQTQAAINFEKLQQAQNKTAETTLKLNDVQARAAQQEATRQAKAIADQQKRDAAQAVSDAKQIAAAEAKAAKLAEIERKRNVQFPIAKETPNYVTTEPEPVAEQPFTNNVGMGNTAAINEQTAALLEQQEVLGSLTVAQRANIEALLELQAERAANAAELKALNVEDAASGERAVFLTSEQIRLKIAIQEVSVALNRQTKEALAADGAMTKLDQSVLLLRTSYEQLSVAERESEQGQVMLAELNALDAENKKLALSVGNTSKQIGDYEKGQGKASTAMILGDKIANQFTRSIIRMGVQFVLIGVVFAAVTWLYDLIKNMDIFTGRLDQAVQNLKALNAVQKDVGANTGEIIGKYRILSDTVKDLSISYKDRLLAAEELKKLFPQELEHSTAQAIANGTEKKSLDDLTDSVEKLAKAKAAASKIEKISGEIEDLKIQRDKVNSAKESQLLRETRAKISQGDVASANSAFGATGLESTETIKKQRLAAIKNQADVANADIASQIAIKENTIKFLEQYGGLQKEAESLEHKPTKTPKVKDKANTELLEYYRLQLEEVKKNAKLIIDDENQSYFARKQALQVYLTASNALVRNAQQIALADGNISAQKRKNIELKFHNESLDVQRDVYEQGLKLAKENLAKVLEASQQTEQEHLEILNNANKQVLRAMEKHRDEKIDAISLERAKGKISEKEYNKELLAINDQFAIDRINNEIQVQRTILATQEGYRDATALRMKLEGATPEEIAKFISQTNKQIQPTQDRLADSQIALDRAKAKQKIDQTKTPGEKTPQQAEIFALQQTMRAVDELDRLRQKAYEAEISRLEKLSQQIDDNAANEKQHVSDSIASNATKAREIAVIDARAASQKKAIQADENRIKQKEAIAEKEAAIAKIILETAIAAIKAPAELGPILGLAAVPIVLALGAVELAAAAATPIPTFATGTKNYPGGLGIWGEAGMERARLPDGSVRYSAGPELANFPKGTVITPHMELMQLIKPDVPKYAGGEQIGWKEVVKAIERNKPEKKRNLTVVHINTEYESYKKRYLSR